VILNAETLFGALAVLLLLLITASVLYQHPSRPCPNCGAAVKLTSRTCPRCYYQFAIFRWRS
jgi:hypothetical protein